MREMGGGEKVRQNEKGRKTIEHETTREEDMEKGERGK